MHAPSQPSWLPHAPARSSVRADYALKRLALSTLAISILMAASIIWLIVHFL